MRCVIDLAPWVGCAFQDGPALERAWTLRDLGLSRWLDCPSKYKPWKKFVEALLLLGTGKNTLHAEYFNAFSSSFQIRSALNADSFSRCTDGFHSKMGFRRDCKSQNGESEQRETKRPLIAQRVFYKASRDMTKYSVGKSLLSNEWSIKSLPSWSVPIALIGSGLGLLNLL